MLRVTCAVCGSIFLTEVSTGIRTLCPACRTVDAAVKKHTRPKRNSPAKPEKGKSDGTSSPS